MNIVFVFDGLQVGGIERVGVDYINLLINRGHNVSVVNLIPSLNDFYPQLPKSCTVHEYKFSRDIVPYRFAKLSVYGIWGAIIYSLIGSGLSVLNVIRKLLFKCNNKLKNTDIVIAFSGHFNDLMFVASGFLPGKKIAWLHGTEFEYKIISEGYFTLYRKIKNLVCLSEACDITCKKYNEENQIDKQLIYNPMVKKNSNIDQSKVNDLKNKYGNFCLMVARLAPDKDQKTAILAINYLNEKRNDKIHLLLAGDGPLRKELEKFVSNLSMSDYIHFMGNCFDIENYYSAAYVYVHSSPCEGLPTVLLEALAYNVPIASTDSFPGSREILLNNYCGLISPVGDWKSLGDNIEALYGDNELREKLKENGKKRLNAFSPDEIVKKLEHFLFK